VKLSQRQHALFTDLRKKGAMWIPI
jgi:hypothetical protein